MATLDFSPLFRSSIGFDQLAVLLSHALERPEAAYPPHNIEKIRDDEYRVVMALAGFRKEDIEIVQEHRTLTIRGATKDGNGKTYLHRGIATRAFERRFDLADYVEVTDATMGEGMLVITLKREIPDALRPRSIPINEGMFLSVPRTVLGAIGHQDDQRAA